MTQSGHELVRCTRLPTDIDAARTAFCKALFGSVSISVLGEPFRRGVRERKPRSGLQRGSISRLELEAPKRRYEHSIRCCFSFLYNFRTSSSVMPCSAISSLITSRTTSGKNAPATTNHRIGSALPQFVHGPPKGGTASSVVSAKKPVGLAPIDGEKIAKHERQTGSWISLKPGVQVTDGPAGFEVELQH